jgi:hypothetical protein
MIIVGGLNWGGAMTLSANTTIRELQTRPFYSQQPACCAVMATASWLLSFV